ncbi:MAG: ErfK/YbiS/YcfS/YnhG family protein [Actinomycetia bacterium]|nr:ErfK/YbiS/YcfS/YnhG family protein [Actinomycetes bacterium]
MIVVVLAIVLCAGIGMSINAARSDAARDRARDRADAATQRLNAERATLMKSVTFFPRPGTVDAAPTLPVSVTAGSGRLTAVSLKASDGRPVRGMFDSSAKRWQSRALLVPATTYRVTATTAGASGVTVAATSAFRTVTPTGRVAATVFPDNGMTVGVAQPIVIRFDHFIDSDTSRAAVLSHLTVTESRPVPGGWHWFSTRELHFRPQQLWPSGEQVTLDTNLDGWDAGHALWGTGRQHVRFTIGRSHISVANLSTDQMTVSEDGHIIATYPFSGGRPTDPTMNGMHIVMDTQSVVRMISSTNGIPVNSPDGYDELVYADVHISDSGEYVHSAPWSVNSQGRTNVSHGCINLSPPDALAFFAFSHIGDVIQVVGGPRPPATGDHGVMDWDTPWSDWTRAVVSKG